VFENVILGLDPRIQSPFTPPLDSRFRGNDEKKERRNMLKKIDHIAVVVKDVEKAAKSYADMFGFKVVEKRGGPGGEFTSVMMALGDIGLELFQPLKSGSFSRFLEEKGGGLHHVSFVTDDIVKEMKTLKAQGKKLQNEEPMVLPDAKIAFVHPSAAENVLIELVERG
jgi:methylmalonyl-CoA/ethylmalonyl-CoA epimerase